MNERLAEVAPRRRERAAPDDRPHEREPRNPAWRRDEDRVEDEAERTSGDHRAGAHGARVDEGEEHRGGHDERRGLKDVVDALVEDELGDRPDDVLDPFEADVGATERQKDEERQEAPDARREQ